MAYSPENPFDSIEGAHQYVSLLGETLEQAQGTIQEDIAMAHADGALDRFAGATVIPRGASLIVHQSVQATSCRRPGRVEAAGVA